MTTLSIRKPVANKTHSCTWCEALIQVGTKYLIVAHTFSDDGFAFNRYHFECRIAESNSLDYYGWHNDEWCLEIHPQGITCMFSHDYIHEAKGLDDWVMGG